MRRPFLMSHSCASSKMASTATRTLRELEESPRTFRSVLQSPYNLKWSVSRVCCSLHVRTQLVQAALVPTGAVLCARAVADYEGVITIHRCPVCARPLTLQRMRLYFAQATSSCGQASGDCARVADVSENGACCNECCKHTNARTSVATCVCGALVQVYGGRGSPKARKAGQQCRGAVTKATARCPGG